MRAISNRRIFITAIIVIFIILLLSYYLLSQAPVRFDNAILDAFFRLRGPAQPGADIVLVAPDAGTSRVLQHKQRRSDFGIAVDHLTAAGVDLIAIDYLFTLPDPDPDQDQALSKAMEESANVILVSDVSDRNRSVPHSLFRDQEIAEGFLNIIRDPDGVVRKIPSPFGSVQEDGSISLDFPLALQIALARLYPEGNIESDLTDPRLLKLGELHIPYAGNTEEGFYINYIGPAGTFKTIPLHDVINSKFKQSDVAGKIVLIGSMNPLEHDTYPVPFHARREVLAKGVEVIGQNSMYGVEIHANALHTVLNRRFLSPVPKKLLALSLGVLILLSAWIAIGLKRDAFAVAALNLVLLALLSFISYRLFLNGVIVHASPFALSIFLIALTGLIARQVEEASQKRYITRLFGQYVAANVVKELIRNRDLLQLGGRKERLTIFFSDVRGFTAMSEKMTPEQVSALLNEYFTRMTRIVFKHGGTLDKFMGDCIMAFFGNPLPLQDHARRAVSMSLEMREEMKALKEKWTSEGKASSFEIGIGINTGEVVVGNLGSDDFFDYTVIGDVVNLANRIESIAKPGQIIISAETFDEVRDYFEVAKLPPVTVKGKSQPVEIYEVLSARPASV